MLLESVIVFKSRTIYYHFVDKPTETQLSSSVEPVEEGKPLLITCTARANPSAEYKFYRDGKLVSSSSTGVLTFVSVKKEDQGTYRCVPYNQLGEGPEASITVTIEGKQVYCAPVTSVDIESLCMLLLSQRFLHL